MSEKKWKKKTLEHVHAIRHSLNESPNCGLITHIVFIYPKASLSYIRICGVVCLSLETKEKGKSIKKPNLIAVSPRGATWLCRKCARRQLLFTLAAREA